ncbi:MAG TPA: hypothetical protein VFB14_18460 [Bryobacteraceae bacterium]|nr:hypothetical protein [Bryobacteraceae bacterium]
MELPARTLVATGLSALPVLAMVLDPRTLLASYTRTRRKKEAVRPPAEAKVCCAKPAPSR